MENTIIVKVDMCHNESCRFCLGRQCITTPEMDVKSQECISNTDDWVHFISSDDIIKEDEE